MIISKTFNSEYSKDDGYRIYVDETFPRNFDNSSAHIQLWLKDAAPSRKLLDWFSNDINKWEGFKRDYIHELYGRFDLIQQIKEIEKEHDKITLVSSAKDDLHNSASLLMSFIKHGGTC